MYPAKPGIIPVILWDLCLKYDGEAFRMTR